jgi:hypothetical protein
MVEITKSSQIALHFEELGCSLVHDSETEEWALDFDDDEKEAVIVESREQPFVETFIRNGISLTKDMFEDMKTWLREERKALAEESK